MVLLCLKTQSRRSCPIGPYSDGFMMNSLEEGASTLCGLSPEASASRLGLSAHGRGFASRGAEMLRCSDADAEIFGHE